MDTDLIKSQENFSFHLKGNSSVDAVLLSKTIQDFAELSKLIALEENPDAFIRLNVTAFENGSFIIDFQTIIEIAETIVDNKEVCLAFASMVVGGIMGVFQIKKFLKGEPPAEQIIQDNSIKIKNKNGDVLVAPKSSAPILNNCQVDNLVINIASNSSKNNNGQGFSLSSSNMKDIEIDNADMHFMCNPTAIEAESISTVKTQIIDAYLRIKKPVLVGPAKWVLIYKGDTIDVKIDDEDWLTSVQEGSIGINANYLLHAKLQIDVELSDDGVPIKESQKYKIPYVYGLIKNINNSQLSL